MQNEELEEELQKLIIRKLVNEHYTHLLQRIFRVLILLICNCLANLIQKFFLCVTEIFMKYAWVTPLKGKNDITITNAFQKMLE